MIDKERRREERNYLGSQGDFFFFTELSLQCFSQAFSSCSEWGTLSSCGVWASYCRGFSPCRAQALRVQTQKLWCIGWLSSRHVGSSCTRDQTCVPCIGRQIPNHWTTREILTETFCLLAYILLLFYWQIWGKCENFKDIHLGREQSDSCFDTLARKQAT